MIPGVQLAKYQKVFAVKGFPIVMALGLLAKLPIVAIPIILTLHVATTLDRGYAQAGLVIAVWTAGVTVAAPVQGRFIQRYGLRPSLLIVTVAQGLFWCLAPLLSFPLFAAGALVSGLLLVSGSTVVRLAIGGLVPEEHRHTAFAVDSVITEISIMIAPVIAVLVTSAASTNVALVVLGLTLIVSCGSLAVFSPSVGRAGDSAAPAAGASPKRSWLNVRLIAVLACSLAAGAIVTGYEVVVVGTLRSTDQLAWTGVVLFGCAVCSLLGGLLYGALPRGLPVPLMIGLLAVATMPLGLAGPQWWLLALAIIPAAALVAPGFAATANAASHEAGAGSQAVVMSFYGSALSAGSALGAPLAGAAFEFGGANAGFVSVGGLGVIVAVLAWIVVGRGSKRVRAS
ncbi:MFS transporter [Actinophytocola sp.]|uniref:MFS transporter n=1 Tax=Actinophytocola sp. TaxID=1872138 RepID=UPI00389A9458